MEGKILQRKSNGVKKKILLLIVSFLFLGIATSVFAVAYDNSGTPYGSSGTQKPKFDPTCIQTALEKRENAIIAAYNKKTAAIKAALEQRKIALKEAWGKPTVRERVLARVKAWQAFKTAQYKANKTYQTESKAAWQQFYKDRKACKTVTEANDEPNLIDQNL